MNTIKITIGKGTTTETEELTLTSLSDIMQLHLMEQGIKIKLQRALAGMDVSDHAACLKKQRQVLDDIANGKVPSKGGSGTRIIDPVEKEMITIVVGLFRDQLGIAAKESRKVIKDAGIDQALLQFAAITIARAKSCTIDEVDTDTAASAADQIEKKVRAKAEKIVELSSLDLGDII